MTRSGHFSRALATVSAVRIPSFFAGIDAAVTIPWRVFRSPPTIEGMVRKSPPPGSSRRSFTADHDKNAEFTSTWKIVLMRALYYCEEIMAIWAWSCAQASVTTVYPRPPVSLISITHFVNTSTILDFLKKCQDVTEPLPSSQRSKLFWNCDISRRSEPR